MKSIKMIEKTINFVVVGVFLLALSAPLVSQEAMKGPGKGMDGPGMMRERGMRGGGFARIYHVIKTHKDELKVSEGQMEKIEKIFFASEEKNIAIKNKLALQGLEMKKLMMTEGNNDYKAIEAVMARMSELRRGMFIEGLKTGDAIKNILTKEQQEALKKLKMERPGRNRMHSPRRSFRRERGMEKREPASFDE